MEMEHEKAEIRTLSGVNFCLGLWLAVSPYLLGYVSSAARWNQTIFGIIVLTLSAIRFAAPYANTFWASWLNSAIGIWLILAPFLLNYVEPMAYLNEVVVGVMVTMIAFWNATIYPHHTYHHSASR